MTYIKSITLRGFKSFARETTIEFDKGFSAIVGPNGSGKSNISDGILFVLGKLGSKGLRADTSASLIHNGGAGGKPSFEAAVELCLDNADKTLPYQETDVKVRRIVRRNGTSIYKINDDTRTRQEVLELLSKVGLSPHGFNIILQGTISRFVEMKNEERRMIIENIAGISNYEERKKKSLHELERTEDRLKEIKIILAERGSYLKNLERERQQALLYQKLKEDISIAKAALILKQISKKQADAAGFGKRIEAERKKVDGVKMEIAGMQKEISGFFEEIGGIAKKIEEATGKEQTDLRRGIVEVKSNIASLEAKRGAHLDQIKSNLDREKQLVFELEQNEKSLVDLNKEIKDKPKKFDTKLIGQEIVEDEKRLIGNVDELVKKIRKTRAQKVDRQELLSFLETIENVCLIIKELVIKIRENREHLASPKKFEDEVKLGSNRIVLENEVSRIKLFIRRGKEENEKFNKIVAEIEEQLKKVSSVEKSTEELEKGFEKRFKDLFEKRNELEIKARAKEEQVRAREEVQWQIDAVLKQIEIDNARIDETIRGLNAELAPFEKHIEAARNVRKNEERLQEEITNKVQRLEEFGGINMRALEVYDEAKKEFDEIEGKAGKLEEEKIEILRAIDEIDKKKSKEFMKTFNQINENFTRIFSKLSTKGTAHLELENKDNPFEEGTGIDVMIRLGKGKFLDTRSLSGGEKSLTALAFIFAIQEYKPYHFYLLDEVEAALDKRNSELLAHFLQGYIRKAQYICITHNDAMIHACDKIYGVSMQNGSSKIVSLKL